MKSINILLCVGSLFLTKSLLSSDLSRFKPGQIPPYNRLQKKEVEVTLPKGYVVKEISILIGKPKGAEDSLVTKAPSLNEFNNSGSGVERKVTHMSSVGCVWCGYKFFLGCSMTNPDDSEDDCA